MKSKIFKIFRTSDFKFMPIPYDSTIDYFSFVKKQKEEGLYQFIITSDIILDLINLFIDDKGYSLKKIILMNSDDELDTIINDMVLDIQNEVPYALTTLTSKLSILSDKDCIDIQKVDFTKRFDKKSHILKIQANGIVYVNMDDYDKISSVIVDEIKNVY